MGDQAAVPVGGRLPPPPRLQHVGVEGRLAAAAPGRPGSTTSRSATRPRERSPTRSAACVDAQWPLDGVNDHGTHEALYLRDPDGNGLELAWDRDPSEWPLDDEGQLRFEGGADVNRMVRELLALAGVKDARQPPRPLRFRRAAPRARRTARCARARRLRRLRRRQRLDVHAPRRPRRPRPRGRSARERVDRDGRAEVGIRRDSPGRGRRHVRPPELRPHRLHVPEHGAGLQGRLRREAGHAGRLRGEGRHRRRRGALDPDGARLRVRPQHGRGRAGLQGAEAHRSDRDGHEG